jgi:hypothetical protein
MGKNKGQIMTKNTGFNIDDYDEVAACEHGYEFEAKKPDGSGTGLFITVRGTESKLIQDAIAKKINQERSKAFVAERSGKPQPVRQFEDDISEGIELTVLRIISWRGLVDSKGNEVPFTKEEGLRVLSKFRSLAGQITEASSDLSNFIKG